MVAPAGVNEGVPHDPVVAGGADVEVAEARAAKAEPSEGGQAAELTDTVQAEAVQAEAKPAGVIPAEIVPPPAEPAEGEMAAAPDGKPTGATPAEANRAETTPAEPEPAAGDSGETADPGETSLTDGEHAEGVHTEAGAGEPDWDAGDESRDISKLAVAGIIFGVIALVAVAAGVLAIITHGFRPKTVITYRPAAAFGLRPGECINSGANALNVTVVSCAKPHNAEVFATFSLPDASWPGASALQRDAGNGCQSLLAGYLNPELATADLTQEYVYPNETAWRAGERTVVCEIRAASGPLTGSVRAKG